MIAILAELPPPTADQLYNWLRVAVCLLGIALLVKKLFFPTVPQPMRTKADEDPVLWPIYEKDRDGLRADIARIEHEHNLLAREVAGVKATLEANGLRLVQMDSKLDGLCLRFRVPTKKGS